MSSQKRVFAVTVPNCQGDGTRLETKVHVSDKTQHRVVYAHTCISVFSEQEP